MKFFCYLLIALTISLSSTPCCADDECCNETGTKCSENSADNQHPEESTNTCSPFMVCGSCTGFVVFPMYPDLSPEIEITSDLLALYIQKYFDSHSQSFWQPPKIS